MKQTTFDPHEILEIPPGASRPEIERAYYLARLAYGSDSLASYSLYSPAEKSKILERVERAYKLLMSQETLPAKTVSAARSAAPAESAGNGADTERGEGPGDAGHAREGAPMAPVPPPAQEEPPPPQAARTVPRGRGPLRPIPGGPQVEESDIARPYDALALRKVRKSRGLRLQEISLRTKISLKNLRSIESGGYDDLPPAVYLKGYLIEYAKCLRLRPSQVTHDFLEAAARADRGEAGEAGTHE